jgi:hypothetical protein
MKTCSALPHLLLAAQQKSEIRSVFLNSLQRRLNEQFHINQLTWIIQIDSCTPHTYIWKEKLRDAPPPHFANVMNYRNRKLCKSTPRHLRNIITFYLKVNWSFLFLLRHFHFKWVVWQPSLSIHLKLYTAPPPKFLPTFFPLRHFPNVLFLSQPIFYAFSFHFHVQNHLWCSLFVHSQNLSKRHAVIC